MKNIFKEGSKKTNELIEKIKLSRAQQSALIIVGVTAVLIGFASMLAVWFVKYIEFNGKVIEGMDSSIENYSKSIANSGACVKPKARNGIYTVDELKKCNPDSINVEEVSGSLKHNILTNVSQNVNLESVAKESSSICYNSKGVKYKYSEILKAYQTETDNEKKKDWFETLILCSSLRAIPDALPTVANENALLISINKIYRESGYDYAANGGASSSGGSGSSSSLSGVSTMPITASFEDSSNGGLTQRILKNFEKSIRTFSVSSATVEWKDGNTKVDMSLSMTAYYVNNVELKESNKVVSASKDTKKGK